MADANTVSQLNGMFKDVYADKHLDIRPVGVKFLNMVDFIKAESQLGQLYHQPVVLSHEQGFTYGGAAGDAFTLEDAVSATSRDAQIQGTEMVLRSLLSIGAASRSTNSKAAFISATKLLVENMLKSMARRLEICMMYGQVGIGEVESINVNTIKIEDHEWAAGIWSASEGAKIVFYASDLSTPRGAGSVHQVTSINLTAKEITFDSLPGDIAATDVPFYHTANVSGTFNEFAGLHRIMTNTGSLFNINAGTYNLWKANEVEVGTNFSGGEADLSFEKIEEAVARAMEKGLCDEDVTLLCSPLSWKNLLVEQDAKRSYDHSYKPEVKEAGARSIKFHGPNGMIEIMSSIYVKEGYAYMLPVSEFIRIGSSDITFEQPGMEGKFVRLLENRNGYEMRSYSDQALFTAKPGLCTLLKFIKS
jgi:hypothetical protein